MSVLRFYPLAQVGFAERPTSAADVELLAAYLAHVSAVRGVPAVLRTQELPGPREDGAKRRRSEGVRAFGPLPRSELLRCDPRAVPRAWRQRAQLGLEAG